MALRKIENNFGRKSSEKNVSPMPGCLRTKPGAGVIPHTNISIWPGQGKIENVINSFDSTMMIIKHFTDIKY